MKFDVDYFIAKFTAIPDEKWCRYHLLDQGRSCALGHCGEREVPSCEPGRLFPMISVTDESLALSQLFGSREMVATVNDLGTGCPKNRILGKLNAIKTSRVCHV